jgi:sigma-B regulation protein RsbU (phosphoserine phosphatase)
VNNVAARSLTPIAVIIRQHRQELQALAESWLAGSAQAFGVVINGQTLFALPDDAPPPADPITAPLELPEPDAGHLFAAVPHTEAYLRRLKTNAMLLSRLIDLEQQLESVTSDLVTSQDQLLALYELNHILRTSIDASGSIGALVREIRRLTGVSTTRILFIDPTNRHRHVDVDPPQPIDHAAIDADFAQVAERRQRVLVTAAKSVALSVPLEVRETITGMLTLTKTGEFGSPDIKLAESLAARIGAHLESVLLYQETLAQARIKLELELARQVQSQLLPHSPPRVDGIEIHGLSSPALQVGGDFYDFIASPQHPLLFAVGDVAGKGMSAALVMAMIRTAIRSMANLPAIESPADVLNRLNSELIADLVNLSVFVTAFVGQYRAGSDRLTFANAGHAPVIYRPPGGPAQVLDADHTAIGILDVPNFTNRSIDLLPGAVLIVATDGLTEAENPHGELFGIKRLVASVDALAHLPAAEIATALYQLVDSFTAGLRQSDDQTAVVIKRTSASTKSDTVANQG